MRQPKQQATADTKEFLADLRASLQGWSAARVRREQMDTIRVGQAHSTDGTRHRAQDSRDAVESIVGCGFYDGELPWRHQGAVRSGSRRFENVHV